MAKKVDKTEKQMIAVEEALSKTEVFIEKNQRVLLIVIGVIVVAVLAFYGYKRLYVAPMEKEAQSQMFMAERYFEIDSLNLALYGDGNYLGFIDIIDEYGVTKSANLARYYVGISYLRQGDFEQAIEYLDEFDKKDQIVGPMAYGAMADAYLELDQPGEAARYYMEAANFRTNDFTTPMYLMRAGWTYEMLGEYDRALEAYTRISVEFPRSLQSPEIDKYKERARILSEQE
jgi:tetratricopeptide (TPR) repeat protein